MKALSLLLAAGMVVGCGVKPENYAGKAPEWDLPTFFNGDLVGYGIVTDRSGEVQRRFSVTMQGIWSSPEKGELHEQFLFDDGKKQERIWYLQKVNQKWQGTAGDIVGTAGGSTYGFAMNWNYTLDLDLSSGQRVNVKFDDWMYLIDQQRLINKAEITKFGFKVGEVIIYIEQKPKT